MLKIKLSIKNRFTGSLIFEWESENNTIKETVLEARKQSADLRGAYLQGADLQGADLQGAYLQSACLRGACLQGADLQSACLQGADLQSACLRGADLQGAYLQSACLRGADLQGAYLQGGKIKTAIAFAGLYNYIVIPYITESNERRIKMGCHDRLLNEWESDFWNNPNEFPNDGCLKSQMRVFAFDTAKRWLEIIEKTIV